MPIQCVIRPETAIETYLLSKQYTTDGFVYYYITFSPTNKFLIGKL